MLFQLLEDLEAWSYLRCGQFMQELQSSPGSCTHTNKSWVWTSRQPLLVPSMRSRTTCSSISPSQLQPLLQHTLSPEFEMKALRCHHPPGWPGQIYPPVSS